MIISEIMTKNPATATTDSSVAEVLATLHDLDVRHLPIVDGNELVGIVSDRDLRSFVAIDLFNMLERDEIREKLNTPVCEIMATDLASMDPESEIAEAIDMMLEERIGAIPVVNGASRELVGIISYIDVMRALRSLA